VHWKKKRRQKKLVGASSAKQLLFYAPLLRWYVEPGAVIKAVYRTTTWFVEQVTEVRRKGVQTAGNQRLL